MGIIRKRLLSLFLCVVFSVVSIENTIYAYASHRDKKFYTNAEKLIDNSEVIGNNPLEQATIESSAIIGTWNYPHISGLSKGYDSDTSTCWNPGASAGYVAGEGVVYTLDERYDIEMLKLAFENRYFFFDVFVSSDGSNYIHVATIDEHNYSNYYTDGYVCIINQFAMKDAKYIKIEFTGDSQNMCWISLQEIIPYGRLLQANIQEVNVIGEWVDDRTGGVGTSYSPEKCYDEDVATYWNPCASIGYTSGEGVIFTLDEVYDLIKIQFQFNRYYYFDISVSTDGAQYTTVANVTSRNREKYYIEGYVCILNEIDAKNVKYVKLNFTGDSQNSYWVSFYDTKVYGRESVSMFDSATLLGTWVNDRTSILDTTYSVQKTFDQDVTTYWNPCASAGYSSGEGIVYELNYLYDITELKLTFGNRYCYFDVYVSTDGCDYTKIAEVNEANKERYYVEDFCCVLQEIVAENVKYIKLSFTGSGDNGTWIALYEIQATGDVVAQTSIKNARVFGTWQYDRLASEDATWSPRKSYDEDITTYWNPCASVGYTSDEAIVYTLKQPCNITRLQLLFGNRYCYFDVYVSADDHTYLPIATINADNYIDYYKEGYLCKISNLEFENIRYIKVEFTGDSQDMSWISLYDVKVYSKKTTGDRIRNTTGINAGVDDLGRKLEPIVDCDQSKEVGMFYFLWQGSHDLSNTIYDISKIIKNDVNAMNSHESWLAAGGGGILDTHWWGESLFGYYKQTDEWVIDKDVQMLTDAGIDFLVIDCTNGFTYTNKWVILLRVLDKYYQQGFNVPRVAPMIKAYPGRTIMTVYEEVYLEYPEYNHLWYEMNGKPLMIGDNSAPELSMDCLEYFSFLYPQWPLEEYHANGFPWMDFGIWTEDGNQAVFGAEDSKTMMCVSLAQHSGTLAFSSSAFYGDSTNRTRSWHDGANDTAEDAYLYGYNFAEQFEYAIECNPDIIFITGWNEWIAARQSNWAAIDTEEEPIIFVDNCDVNNSRDIQPMKGGYGDNYYIQMMQYIRQFKGMSIVNEGLNVEGRVIPVTIDVSKSFSQWNNVNWYYLDYLNDIENRDTVGYGDIHYLDNSGRNDIHKIKVVNDANNLYALVQTNDNIEGIGDAHCLSMFISTGNDDNEKWCGYDFAINRVATSNNKLVVEKRTVKGWQKVDEISFLTEGNKVQFAVPLAILGLNSEHVSIEFKIADNYQVDDDVFSFYLYGDVAPYGRANYVYNSDGVFGIKQFTINQKKAVPTNYVQ